MKPYVWNTVKNEWLKEERGISFEEVVKAIEDDKILDIFPHPNAKKYPHQKIIVVEINKYAYRVPLVEDKEKYFLKTCYPSRQATHQYLKEKRKEK